LKYNIHFYDISKFLKGAYLDLKLIALKGWNCCRSSI